MKQQGLLKAGLLNGIMGKEMRRRSYLIHASFTLDFYGSEPIAAVFRSPALDR